MTLEALLNVHVTKLLTPSTQRTWHDVGADTDAATVYTAAKAKHASETIKVGASPCSPTTHQVGAIWTTCTLSRSD